MNASQTLAQPVEVVRVVELGSASTTAWKQRQAQALEREQRRFVLERERRDDRKLGVGQLGDKCMLFKDLCVAPAFRSIELGDQRFAVVQPDLVDAVLVAVEGEQSAVWCKSGGLDRLKDDVRSEYLERVRIARSVRLGSIVHSSTSADLATLWRSSLSPMCQ